MMSRARMVVAMLLCHCHPRQTSAPAVPFSFLLDGAAVDLSRWSTSSNITQLDGVRTQTTISFAHPRQQDNAVGLKAQLQRTDYLFSHGSHSEQSTAEELLLRFRNDGATDSPLLCDVSTLDRTWPLAASAAATLHTNGGSFARAPPEFDYSPGIRDVPLGANISISPEEGMSSDGVMPWFALELSSDGRGGGGGAVLSLGWTGNWRLRVTRSTRGVRLRASVGDLCATIHPGEMFRVLRVLLVPVVSRPAVAGQPALRKTSETALRAAMNLHRRVLVDYKVPRKPSDHTAFQGALTASWTWGAWPAPELNESGQQQHIAWIDQIGADAWWLDAGWFNAPPGSIGRTGSFPSGIGNWRLPASDSINKTMFPRGLAPLSTAARAKGLRSVVWFDIEGVFPETTIWNMTHKRDLCFRDFASGRRCQLADSRSLLNLGNNRTWQYLLDFSISAIEEYSLDVFRLDYNVGLGDEPCAMLPCWRAADSPTRKGMAEVSYVQGLYDLWDALLTRFASRDLFLDNCAGGGRRIDLETSSRSVPLWRTDAGCPSAEASQAMTMGISVVLPISSGATCGTDSTAAIEPYMWRSAGVVGKVISWGPATWQAIVRDQKLLALARAAVAETKRIRPIAIEGDYYPLTAINVDDRMNVAYQFHRDRMGHNDGVVCVFHRSRAPAEFSIQLEGVDPAATYQLQFSRNYSVEKNVTMLGAQMRSAVGLSFQLSNAQQMPRIGSFSPPRMQNATRLWGSLAGPTFHATTLVDCVNACARLGAVCEGATLTLSTTGTGAQICYPLTDISRVQFEDAPGYASVLHHDVCVGTQTRQCSGSMLIEYTQVKTPTPTGTRPVLVAENEAVAGKKLISIFPSSLHTVPGDGGLFLSVAGVHDGTLGNGREFFSKDAVNWEEVSPNCSAQANCHRPAGGNDSTFPLFQAAPCVPRLSDASLLCWPKRLDLVGDPTNSTEGRVAAQRWSGEPLAIANWETVTYKTDIPFGRSGSFENKFAVVADGDPPVALKNGSGWLLTAYASHASSDLTFTLLAMFSRDGILWEQRAIIKNSSGIGPVLPKIPGRPCFDEDCTNQACANPNESTLTRLADGSLAVFYRNGNELSTDYAENVPLCVQFSYDEGTSWSAPHVVSPPPPPPPPGPPPPPLGQCSILRSFGCQKDLNCAHNRSSRCLRGTGAKGLGQTGAKTGVGTSHTECACACHSRGFTLAGLEGGACFCDHGAAPDPAQCGEVAPANQSRVCADNKTIPGERGGFCAVEVFSFHCPSNASCAPTSPPEPARSDGPKGVEPRSAITARGQLVVVSGRDGLFAWMVGLAQIVDGPWRPFNIAEHHNMFYGNQTVNTTCGEETLAFPPETVLGTKRTGATSGYMGITRLGDALVICYDHMLHCAGTTRVYCFQLSDV